jgi:CHAT domain-containing protein
MLIMGCSSSYRMGDPIKAHAVVKPTSASNAPIEPQDSTANTALDSWDQKWREIQRPADTVDWIEHFQICAIKYRYRNYDELFRCLDLFEAKISRGGKHVSHIEDARRVAPVLSGWLRGYAYADLGDPDASFRWADSAWKSLPADFRNANVDGGYLLKSTDYKEFLRGTARVAGFSMSEDQTIQGRDNPAGLDMAPETIAMSLAAQRSLMYQQHGDAPNAKIALGELQKWEALTRDDGPVPFVPWSSPYKVEAQLLSIGPLFAMGDYAEVVRAYDESSAKRASERHTQQFYESMQWLMLPAKLLMEAQDALMSAKDTRVFAIAVEDASNALIYAESLERLGKTNEARGMLDTLLALPELRAMGNLYWATLYERGLIALKEGKRDDAIGLFQQSTQAIESVRSTIAFEAAKIGFAGDKQAVYAALVTALAENGNWQEAFVAAERAKARSLVDLLAQQRDLAAPPASDDKVRALLAQATSVAVAGLPTSETAVRSVKLVADSRAELASVAPEAASLVAVQSVSIAEIAARMTPGESLIDYYGTGDDLYALVLNGTTVTGFKLSAQGLDADVRAFRDAIERRDPNVTDRARALYNRLIRPLAAQLKGNKLTISPHGVLHYLPFDALMDGDQYLLDRFGLRLIPSAGTLVYLKADHPTKVGTLLALGNPDLGNPSYDLPNAQIEAVNVAALFPASKALVRADASKTAIRELGGSFSMLHFATHGKFNSDTPLASGLYLARGSDADGVLSVGDLYALHFDADLVTLSACETGLGKVANGDDVIGLTRGFLYAGARSIVASLWEVDDAATEQLMLSFYGNLQSHDKREALRLAQIETRVRYPQPLFWAAFQIVGRAD